MSLNFFHADREDYRESLGELQTLFKKSFGREISTDFIKWRYIDNPTGDFLAALCTDGNKIVANYSASPCTLTDGEEEYASALSMTTMTHPEYRGRGIFPKLAKMLYEKMGNEGYSLVWGFPNNISHRYFVEKLDWFDVSEIPTMKINPNNARKEKLSQTKNVKRDDNFNLDYDKKYLIKDLFKVSKYQKYLKWRYKNNPLNDYMCYVVESGDNVRSWIIFKRYEDQIDVVDFYPDCRRDAKVLASRVIKHAMRSGALSINAWAPVHHFMHNILEEIGFTNQNPVTYFGAKLTGSKVKNIDNYKNWFIQMGDSDVY